MATGSREVAILGFSFIKRIRSWSNKQYAQTKYMNCPCVTIDDVEHKNTQNKNNINNHRQSLLALCHLPHCLHGLTDVLFVLAQPSNQCSFAQIAMDLAEH